MKNVYKPMTLLLLGVALGLLGAHVTVTVLGWRGPQVVPVIASLFGVGAAVAQHVAGRRESGASGTVTKILK